MVVQRETRDVYSSGGDTYVGYTKNGEKLLVAGSNGLIRIYEVSQEDSEPSTIDILDEISGLAVLNNDRFAISSKVGEAAVYSVTENKLIGKVVRSPLPLRDLVFTHDGTMLAAAGDDEEIQIADLKDDSRIIKFKVGDQVHDISYNASIDLISVSLSNGDIKIYSLTSEAPKLVTSISDEIPKLIYQDDDDDDDDNDNGGKEIEDNLLTARVEWHPNGDFLAIPCTTSKIKVFSRTQEYNQIFSFVSLHKKRLTALKWSTSGDYLASGDLDNKLIIWDSSTREPVIQETLPKRIINLAWRKSSSGKYDLSVGSEGGDIFIFKDVVQQKSKAPAVEESASALLSVQAEEEEGGGGSDLGEKETNADEDELDNALLNDNGPRDFDDNDDGFIEDDDGQGYVVDKRKYLDDDESLFGEEEDSERPTKRSHLTPSQLKFRIKPYSQGCTPYIADRRYLTINSSGYVFTVKQDAHSAITVSFFDSSVRKEYHFEDLLGYDLASLSPEGLLLGLPGQHGAQSRILYRPHDSVADSWEKQIPTRDGEFISSISLSDSTILVCTSLGFIRTYTLFGLPIGIQKSSPIVASANNSNYIFTISVSNSNQLIYNLQDLDGRFLQRDLTLPLDLEYSGDFLRGIFFSAYGDPIIMGNDGVLLVLSRWRDPLQARWVPILDSESQVKEIGAKGELLAWPLGLNGDQLSCILVRGSNYPTYPLPLPSELEVKMPLVKEANDEEKAEEEFLRAKTMGELLGETLTNDGEIYEDDNEKLNNYANLHDRAVLKLFATACSNDRAAKAWQLAKELKQDQALVACNKISERMGLVSLSNRIIKLREQRMENEDL